MSQSFHRSFAPGGNSIRIREDTNAAPTAPGFQLRWKRLRRPPGPDQYVARISLHGFPVFLTIFPNMDRKTVTPGLSPCYPNAPRVTFGVMRFKYRSLRLWPIQIQCAFNPSLWRPTKFAFVFRVSLFSSRILRSLLQWYSRHCMRFPIFSITPQYTEGDTYKSLWNNTEDKSKTNTKGNTCKSPRNNAEDRIKNKLKRRYL